MTITSVPFLLFLVALFAIFYICPVRYRWTILLAGSIWFYVVAGAVKFLPFIIYTSFVVWICARAIGKLYESQEKKLSQEGLDRKEKKQIKEEYKNKARKYLVLALVLCIGFLAFVKFGKYFVEYANQIAAWRGLGRTFSAEWILFPLGVSYYTFSTVGYILDVYWRRYDYEKNFFRFFLYAIYFPHIMQGPISRYNLLGQELKKELRFDWNRIMFGMQLMLWGFFKKLVIADRLNIFVSGVFETTKHSGSIFLVAMIFDAFQIYTDFSGYTDIVRGVSQVFGVELEKNFNHPFFSKTVPEYWRRWHMTLGGWFKDYVYYPCTISGFMKNLNKKTKKSLSERQSRFIAVVIPVFLTWVLTGLWHGTGKTYVAWGIYYSTLITISVAFQPEFQMINQKLGIRTESKLFHVFQMVRTFICFMGGRILTTPGSLTNTYLVLKNVFFNFNASALWNGRIYNFDLGKKDFLLIAICLIVLWCVDMMQERFSVREKLAQQNIIVRWLVIYAAIFAIIIFGIYGQGYDASAFLYTQY
jgi:D-alanyl-lipoteichoic acid acyltransferase DltB (MBOAT superfamily)